MLTNIISYGATSYTVHPIDIRIVYIYPGIPYYGNVGMIALVAFLYLKEILPKSEKWNSDNNYVFNMVITPLLYNFIGILLLKIIEILQAPIHHGMWV